MSPPVVAVLAAVLASFAHPGASAQGLDAALLQRIDAFVEREREASRIPGMQALLHVEHHDGPRIEALARGVAGLPLDDASAEG